MRGDHAAAPLIVIPDIQHVGKRSHPTDRGARAPDADEADLVQMYVYALAQALQPHGIPVRGVGWGDYSYRWSIANAVARATPGIQYLYLACHLNAGSGNYALMLPDARSTSGQQVAPHLTLAVGKEFGIPSKVTLAEDEGWTRNALNTIRGIYPGPANIRAVCVEPLFVDGHAHLMTHAGMVRVGAALARGIVEWWQSATHLHEERTDG